jgi:c-di-GMP-binding flagellar brake protein YcgR
MGASSQPRKNPYMAQGLLPGLTLRLAVSRREDADYLVTQLEEVSDSSMEVLVPMRRLRATPLPTGTRVFATYVYRRKQWRFTTEVTGTNPECTVQYLRLPGEIESSERRNAFRLETSIKPSSLYRLVIDKETLPEDAEEENPNIEGTIVDLSEGGLCLSSAARFTTLERLGVQATLGEGIEFTARMVVTGIEDPIRGRRNRRVHCHFTDISRADREKVARFLMRRQLEMRRRGQL